VIHVATCGNDAWTGASSTCAAPAGPKRTIQVAIDAAANGDTILVADGTYTGPGNVNIRFGGRAITVKSAAGPALCIIDVEASSAQHRRAFRFVDGETSSSILEGFTIRNGYATRGGGMIIESSSPLIRQCIFINNTAYPVAAWEGGGAVTMENSGAIFDACRFEANHAQIVASLTGGGGGALWAANSSPTFTSCEFVANTATGAHGTLGSGGAVVVVSGSNATLMDCVLSGNHCENAGGAMSIRAGPGAPSSATITGCDFEGNTAYQIAGLLVMDAGVSTVTNSRFTQNISTQCCGGIAIVFSAAATVTDCTFTANTAGTDGGGGLVVQHSASASVSDCVFDSNTAVFGAGIWIGDSAQITIEDSTALANTAASTGGGLMAVRGSRGTVSRSAFTGNLAGWGGAISIYGDGLMVEPLVLTDCMITGNSAANNGGGAYIASFGRVSLVGAHFASNQATFGGGLWVGQSSQADVVNSMFTQNTASAGSGGGTMLTNNASGSFANCLFVSNQANFGGGAWVGTGANAGFTNCTYAHNSSPNGGGIRVGGNSASTVSITNSILWSNTQTQASVVLGILTITRSAVQGGWPGGVGNIATDPVFIDPAAGDFRLSSGSPCIDYGDNAAIPSGLTTDLDGRPRLVSVGMPSGAGIVDLGAYEFQGGICYANCDGSTIAPLLNVDDFTCFINTFAIAQTLPHAQQLGHYTNCDGSTAAPVLNVDDFTCFINAYAAGCP
jgi:hypothetical protein